MGHHRQYQQTQSSGNNLWWMLVCVCIALALALAGLPWIIIGLATQRLLSRWLHWRVSFLLWFALLFLAAFTLYNSYQHGLESLWLRELTDYTHAGERSQLDLAAYPLRQLWAETWPVWLYTWPGIGIAGFVGEVYTNRNDTARTLRQHERHRKRRAQRLQHRARSRTSRPARISDEAGGHMVIGIPIQDDEEE